jgi:hypothetical protein
MYFCGRNTIDGHHCEPRYKPAFMTQRPWPSKGTQASFRPEALPVGLSGYLSSPTATLLLGMTLCSLHFLSHFHCDSKEEVIFLFTDAFGPITTWKSFTSSHMTCFYFLANKISEDSPISPIVAVGWTVFLKIHTWKHKWQCSRIWSVVFKEVIKGKFVQKGRDTTGL